MVMVKAVIAALLLISVSFHPCRAETVDDVQMRLDAESFASRVLDVNDKIIVQYLEWQVSREAINVSESIFEPEFSAGFQHLTNRKEYNIEDKRTGFPPGPAREDVIKTYNAAIEELIPTGGKLSLMYNLQDISNIYNKDEGAEFDTGFGASLVQPLLKGAGVKTTMAAIYLAETDADIEFQRYRQMVMRVIAGSLNAFWDLRYAQELRSIREESVDISEKILNDVRDRFNAGKMPETEVIEADAGHSYRRALEIESIQFQEEMTDRVFTFLATPATDAKAGIFITSAPLVDPEKPNLEARIEIAFKNRPDYLINAKIIEKEDIRVAFAENQRWPQLDLKASYFFNGLAHSHDDSWTRAFHKDSPTWNVGMEFKIPLMGGKKTKSELVAAKYRQEQALNEFKAVEIELINAVNSAVSKVENAGKQVGRYSYIRQLKEKLLKLEMVRSEAGRGNISSLLDKEADLMEAREMEAESLILYMKAGVNLSAIDGSILKKYSIDDLSTRPDKEKI